VVRWDPVGDHHVDLGTGPTPDPSEHTHVMRVPSRVGSARLAAPGGRAYVSVSWPGTTVVAAERRVPFAGPTNFRDLGGYPTESGGRTRWGQVFRADNLYHLTAGDLEVFDALGIGVIYDLRRDDEREVEPGPRDCLHLTLPCRKVLDTAPRTPNDRNAGERWLFEEYCGFLARAGPVFGLLFTELADGRARPSVFHCAGGKDRTGMTAALLLSWLGVDRETVLDDYELTGSCASPERLAAVTDLFVQEGIPRPVADGLLSAPRWAMAEALALLDDDYGGIEPYLRGPAGMSAESLGSLRARLVG
jgi:protein-tyrosine phosphatase